MSTATAFRTPLPFSQPTSGSPVVQYVQVNGIPVCWVQQPGPTTAGLVFRVGMNDEPLRLRGLTHFIEHLALARLGSTLYSYNGSTAGNLTTFHATGSPQEVTEFLHQVAYGLASLPLERIPTETKILQAESCSKSSAAVGTAMLHRFGTTGPGRLGYSEFAMMTEPPAEVVTNWASTHFTASNAAIWIVGSALPDLNLSALPKGPGFVSQLASREAFEVGPQRLVRNQNQIVLVSVVNDRPGMETLVSVVRETLFRRLRMGAGISYSPFGYTSTEDGGHLLAVIGCDGKPDDLAYIEAELLRTLECFSCGDFDSTVVEFCEALRRRSVVEDSNSGMAEAINAAQSWLYGKPHTPSLATEPYSLFDLAECAEDLFQNSLWMSPVEAGDNRLSRHVDIPRHQLQGHTFTSKNPEAVRTLLLSQHGVGMLQDNEPVITTLFQSLELAVRYTDGVVEFIDRSGCTITVAPQMWFSIGNMVDGLLQTLPQDRLLHMPEPYFGPDHPVHEMAARQHPPAAPATPTSSGASTTASKPSGRGLLRRK